MASLKFPDTGTRYVELPNGKPALGQTGYLYQDAALTVVAEAYADVNGVKGALLPTDENGRRYIRTDGYGRQVDYWGPVSGQDRLWIVINGVASPVDADYNARIDSVETRVTAVEGSVGSGVSEGYVDAGDDAAIATAAADATTKANNAQSAAISTAASDATTKANAAQAAAVSTASSDATSKVAAHTVATDPHGDRAAAATDATSKANAAQAAAIAASAQRASNLSDLASAPTARTNLGLGDSATRSVGTGSGNVAAGDAPAAAQAAAVQRANHSGTQSADTLTDGTTNKAFLATERTKLAGIATGATATVDATTGVKGIVQLAGDLAGAASAPTVPALANKVGKTDLVFNVADYPGVDITGSSFSDTGINLAITAAGSTGTVHFPRGTYKTNTTLVFTCNVTSSPDAIISYNGATLAVQLGTDTSGVFLQRKSFHMPQVIYAPKVGLGWTAGTIGVKAVNVYRSMIRLNFTNNFETGLLMYGKGAGTAYCEVYPGHLSNNKVNQKLDADSTGFVNQNTFIAGSWSHSSNEGANLPGTKHIYLVDITGNSDPNNNTWLNPSIESPTVVEYSLDIAGSYNIFLNARFEFTAGNAKILWRAAAIRNWIFGGTVVDDIEETHTAGSYGNSVIGTERARFMPSAATGYLIENTGSSNSAAWTIMRAGGVVAGDNPATAYAGRLQASAWRLKRFGDAADRIIIDATNGKVLIGDGTVAPTIQWSSGTNSPEGVVTAGIGSLYSRANGGASSTLYIKESGTGNTGWVASGSAGGSAAVSKFTSSGTWTKPAGAKSVQVTLIGAGGGGGSGRRGAAASARSGGGGGVGGAVTQVMIDASMLPSSVSVSVGAAGTGALSATANDTNGTAGSAATSTIFGSFFRAFGGAGGAAGASAALTAGSASIGTSPGGVGGVTNITTGAGGAPSGGAGAAGGGGGGSITAADAAGAGGAGQTTWAGPMGATAGAGGVVDTTPPTAGGSVTASTPGPGGSGGGGAASITTAAQAGATGGGYGAGGGGGGASLNGNNSGAGGDGAPGYAEIVTYF